MVVYVLERMSDGGDIIGVFTTEAKAMEYVDKHPYDGYVVREFTLDKVIN